MLPTMNCQQNCRQVSRRNRVALVTYDSADTPMADITENTTYLDIVSLIHQLRRQLVNKRSFRQPYLALLHNLYGSGTQQERATICGIQPLQPTDKDIQHFFWSKWPEIRVAPSDNWGFTITGVGADNAIYVKSKLVERMQEKVCSLFVLNTLDQVERLPLARQQVRMTADYQLKSCRSFSSP
jgi:hypothetical protein